MNIYVMGLILIILGAFFLRDQDSKSRKIYILICALFLGLVLVLRTEDVGSDIGRYRTHFIESGNLMVSDIISKVNNIGFYLYDHFMYQVFNGNYQIYLVITGLITFCPVIWLIQKYAAKPYYSFLAFFCIGYYAFQFSGVKQSMAMAILCFAFHFAMSKKLIKFCLAVALAALFHTPAVIFLPAYLIVNFKFTKYHVFFYGLFFFLVWFFRDTLVVFLAENYDSTVETEVATNVGGKVIFILLLIIVGILIRKPISEDVLYSSLLQFMIVAAAIQLLAVYGNVFERLADYYFFYVVLYMSRIMEPKFREDVRPTLKTDGIDRIYYACGTTGILVLYFWMFGYNTPGLLPYVTWL